MADDARIIYKATGEITARELQALGTLVIALILGTIHIALFPMICNYFEVLRVGFMASWKIALVVIATFPLTIAASAIQMQAMSGLA